MTIRKDQSSRSTNCPAASLCLLCPTAYELCSIFSCRAASSPHFTAALRCMAATCSDDEAAALARSRVSFSRYIDEWFLGMSPFREAGRYEQPERQTYRQIQTATTDRYCPMSPSFSGQAGAPQCRLLTPAFPKAAVPLPTSFACGRSALSLCVAAEVGATELHKPFDFTLNPSDSNQHDADQAGRAVLPRVSHSPGL